MKPRLILLFLLSSLTLVAQSSKVKELENKRKSLLKDIENTNQLISDNKKTTDNVLNLIALLTKQIDSRREIVGLLNDEAVILEKQIADKETEIIQLENELQQKKQNYTVATQRIYTYKNKQDKLLFIFSAKNLAQSYRRLLYLKEYSGQQKQNATEIVSEQSRITTEKRQLEINKQEKQSLIEERKKEEEQLHKEEATKKAEIESLKKNQKTLQAELNKKRKEANALNKQIEKIIAAEIAASQKASKSQPNVARKAATKGGYAMTKEEQTLSSNFSNNRGKLPFPLKGNYKIVKRFGLNKDKDIANIEITSNGIEIETSTGNEARAVFDGVVSQIFTLPGYNNSIIIRHGNYLTLYSYIESVYVKSGDKIKTGQAIGRIYTNTDRGNSTVLHFELWKEQQKLDPLPWLNK